ncbi:MAG TPA: hypothetical protein VJT31_11575, partial [Rugosimonospora sp.]|nr:hypothetical protein [Rugosimonospora sp.]
RQPASGRRHPLPVLARLVRWVVLLALLAAGVAYATVAPLRGWVNGHVIRAEKHAQAVVHPQYTPVHPTRVAGAKALPGHAAGQLSDGFSNTYWAARLRDNATVTLYFDHPVDVSRALIRIGVSASLQSTNRPSVLRVTYSTGRVEDIKLDDTADPQDRTLRPGGLVTSLQLRVAGLYRAQSDIVAITEVELFSRRR